MAAFPLVFAANIELLITIVIILISFVGWLVNFFNEKSRQQQHRRAVSPDGAGDQGGQFQQEIDQFLDQVGGKRPRTQPQDDFEIEVVPEEEIYDREQAKRRRSPISSLEDHHVESGHLGEGIRESVSSHLDSNAISEHVVNSQIDDDLVVEYGDVKSDGPLGSGRPRGTVDPRDIVQALRDPAGIRRAVVINEILTRFRPRR